VNKLNHLNVNYLKIPKKHRGAAQNAHAGHMRPVGRPCGTPAVGRKLQEFHNRIKKLA